MTTVAYPDALRLGPGEIPSPPGSPGNRPFKLIVQGREFLIDSEEMRQMSPIFSVMCFGKDFEGGRELTREIVDEKFRDVDVFLRSVHDNSVINVDNFCAILRLSVKYQVNIVTEACENFVLNSKLYHFSSEDILVLLLSCYEFLCKRSIMCRLIKRLASESHSELHRLRLSKILPAQLFGSVMSTVLNIDELEKKSQYNGHCMKAERSRGVTWTSEICSKCSIECTKCAFCEECKQIYCSVHIGQFPCATSKGRDELDKMRDNLVELNWLE